MRLEEVQTVTASSILYRFLKAVVVVSVLMLVLSKPLIILIVTIIMRKRFCTYILHQYLRNVRPKRVTRLDVGRNSRNTSYIKYDYITSTVLFCSVLFCSVLFCSVLFCTVPIYFCFHLHCGVVCCVLCVALICTGHTFLFYFYSNPFFYSIYLYLSFTDCAYDLIPFLLLYYHFLYLTFLLPTSHFFLFTSYSTAMTYHYSPIISY